MVQRKPVCSFIEDDIIDKGKAGCDVKKMVKKGRSFKHCSSESQTKKASASKFSSGSSPNYMKPTTSSDAKKECLQVSPKAKVYDLSLISNKVQASAKIRDVAGFKPAKNLSRSSNFRPVRPCLKKSCVVAMHPKHSIGRPTCSSTIKDSKFPDYLKLRRGATEAEGMSVVKVCPYTYCSLNGHYHEPLPPLKYFLAGKRKQLKDQRNGQLNESKTNDESIQSQMLVDEGVDFFIEVYAQIKDENDASSDFDRCSDQSSYKISEKDAEECEEQLLKNSLQWDMEEMGTSNSDLHEKFNHYPQNEEANPVTCDENGEELEHKIEEDAESCTEEADGDEYYTFDVHWIDEKEYQSIEEVFCVEQEEKIDKEVANSDPDTTLELPLIQQEENEQETMDEKNLLEQINTEPDMTDQFEEFITIDYSDQDPLPTIEQESKSESDEAIHPEKQNQTHQLIIKEEEEESIKAVLEPNNDGGESYKRKSRMAGEDDEDKDRDFNPRPPNFLPLEPDPDAEKVDLKHQTMDERKNAEEWMVDYALRSTVNKLGSARPRRVELLVEAFETVMPAHKWDSRRRPPCCITHNMPLQACN